MSLRRLWTQFGRPLNTVFSTRDAIERHVATADLVIGGVLVPGAAAPKLVTRAMIASMQAGSVVVDVAIDQGGCFETSHATTHAEPTYVIDGVVHYCVANMPGGVPRTSTFALNNATLPYVLALATKGWKAALAGDIHLRNGLNVAGGKVTHRAVATRVALQVRVAGSGAGELTRLGSSVGYRRRRPVQPIPILRPERDDSRTASSTSWHRNPSVKFGAGDVPRSMPALKSRTSSRNAISR